MNKYLTRLIVNILEKNEDARDSWMLTIKEVHDREMALWCYSPQEYYEAFFDEKLSNVHTIIRIWRFVQEKYPPLRGKTWEERQRQGGIVSQEIMEDKYLQMKLFAQYPNNNSN